MMNSKQRYNARRMTAHNAAKAAEASKDIKLEKNVALSLSGCSARVYKAVILTEYKATPKALRHFGIERDDHKTGSVCIEQVAIFAAGHRKVADSITAR
ncbi:transcriptional regulator [Rahnella sp. ChDrAdgB13]|uniref:transcriptional antitermination N peptide n=1 Tax=Rahnella sp. ChDrAdgB13 TaxID=1850581 RepID=UPI001AD8749C|nr:transcriptional regulator [Rahnella sp. ChDrAdgB13]